LFTSTSCDEFLLGCLDGRVNLALIRDVELEHQSSRLLPNLSPHRVCGRHHRVVAALKHIFGKLAAETGRAAGDKPNEFFCSLFFYFLCSW